MESDAVHFNSGDSYGLAGIIITVLFVILNLPVLLKAFLLIIVCLLCWAFANKSHWTYTLKAPLRNGLGVLIVVILSLLTVPQLEDQWKAEQRPTPSSQVSRTDSGGMEKRPVSQTQTSFPPQAKLPDVKADEPKTIQPSSPIQQPSALPPPLDDARLKDQGLAVVVEIEDFRGTIPPYTGGADAVRNWLGHSKILQSLERGLGPASGQ